MRSCGIDQPPSTAIRADATCLHPARNIVAGTPARLFNRPSTGAARDALLGHCGTQQNPRSGRYLPRHISPASLLPDGRESHT